MQRLIKVANTAVQDKAREELPFPMLDVAVNKGSSYSVTSKSDFIEIKSKTDGPLVRRSMLRSTQALLNPVPAMFQKTTGDLNYVQRVCLKTMPREDWAYTLE